MTDSFKEIQIAESLPFPTLLDLPSSTYLSLTLIQIDQTLNSLTTDVYGMCKFATELKQGLLHLQCKVDFFRHYGTRQLGLIRCIVQNFGANCYYYPKLISCMRACNNKWKRLLFRNIRLIYKDPRPEQIFQYKTQRNTYFLAMIRTINTAIKKILEQFIFRSKLDDKVKKYLKAKGIMKHYDHIWLKMLEVFQQKQEETYLKIYLINQFIQYLLNSVHFCSTHKESEEMFHRFIIGSLYLCRILKKFYSNDITPIIKESLQSIQEGFQLYIQTLSKINCNSIKIDQIKSMITLIQGKKVTYHCSLLNQNSFVIRLILRVLSSWRQIHNKSQKLKNLNQLRSNHQFSLTTLIKKQKVKSIRNSLYQPKNTDLKRQHLSFGKSLSKLNRKKSISSKHLVVGSKVMQSVNQPISNVKIRTEIEGSASRYFKRVNSLTLSRGQSRQKKREDIKKSINQQEKQLKLQDYCIFFSNKSKVVPTLNKIQLYNPDKMQNYYPNKPKAKLKLK